MYLYFFAGNLSSFSLFYLVCRRAELQADDHAGDWTVLPDKVVKMIK